MKAEEVKTQKSWTTTMVQADPSKPETRLQWAGLLFVFFLALLTRLPFFWHVHYPLNDGGMFAQIVDELRSNHFLLPLQTSYNFEHIPLCYPPLGFYFGALAGALLHQATTTVLIWLPLAFNLATVIVFYFLALEFLGAHYLATCASCIYVSVTRGHEWLIMGGGLTRSPGEFFALLSFLFFVKATRRPEIRWAILAGFAAGLASLTHMEAAVLSAVSLTVLALFLPGLEKNTRKTVAVSGAPPKGLTSSFAVWRRASAPFALRRNLFLLCLAGAVCLIVVSPWALWSLATHGTGPYIAARYTHGSSLNILHDKTLLLALGAGVVLAFLKQPPFLIWLFADMFFVPRSGPTHSMIMYALFGAWVIGIIVDLLASSTKISKRGIAVAATLLCCLFWSWKSIGTIRWYLAPGSSRLRELEVNSRASLSQEDADAMRWTRENTKPDAKVFVFNQRIAPWDHDLRAEWFPYIAQRRSIYTVQGTEWLPNYAYHFAEKRTWGLVAVKTEPELLNLIQPADFDYIFLAGPYDSDRARCAALIRSLPDLRLVYKTNNIEIWQRSSTSAQSIGWNGNLLF